MFGLSNIKIAVIRSQRAKEPQWLLSEGDLLCTCQRARDLLCTCQNVKDLLCTCQKARDLLCTAAAILPSRAHITLHNVHIVHNIFVSIDTPI